MKKIQSVNIDFSQFNQKKIENIEFDSCVFKDIDIVKFYFSECIFNNCRFETYLRTSEFKKCCIKKCDFSKAVFYSLNFESTELTDCNFKGLIIDNTFFNSVRIFGDFESAIFIGKKQGIVSKLFRTTLYQPEIDLSNTNVIGIEFKYTDISKIIFPKGENYLLVRNRQEVFERVRDLTFEKKHEQKYGLKIRNVVENMYLSSDKNGMELEFLDLNMWINTNDKELGEELFRLVRYVQGSVPEMLI